tara:strand:+ start:109 stop:960 length:852 start_codon:yes stop_codon:yes gene_type:complete
MQLGLSRTIGSAGVATSGSSYDTNAQAYFDAVETVTGSFDLSSLNATYTEEYVKNAHNDLFTSLSPYWSSIHMLLINCGKTGLGINIPAKANSSMYTSNYSSGNYNPIKDGSNKIGLSVNSSISQNVGSSTGLPTANKEGYTLVSVATSEGYSAPNYGWYYSQSYPTASQISGDIQYDKLQYHIGQNASSSITYSQYSATGYLEFNKGTGQARIKRNGTTRATSGYFGTVYDGSASWQLNLSPSSYSGRFAMHMSYLNSTVPSDIKTAVRTFLAAFGDTTIPA